MMNPLEVDALLYGLDETEIDYETAEPIREAPVDAAIADWHLRKMLAFRAQAEVEDARFFEAIQGLRFRRAERAAIHERKGLYHAGAVEAWHRKEAEEGRADKTLHLPAGVSKLIGARVSVEVVDADKLRAWLSTQVTEDGEIWEAKVYQSQPDAFRVMELGKLVKADPKVKAKLEPGSEVEMKTSEGKVAPGLRAIVQADNWSVKAS